MSNNYYEIDKHNYMRYNNNFFAEYIYSLIADESFANYDTAIEFGAGMGRFSTTLINRFSKIMLIEPTPTYVTFLKKTFTNNHVQVFPMTAEKFILGNNIDHPVILFCFHIMHHLKYVQRRIIYRFLSQTGSKGVFIEPNPINPLILMQIMLHPDMTFNQEIEYLKLTRSRFRREFDKNGLVFGNFKPICFFPPFILNKLIQKVPTSVLKLFEHLNYFFPFINSYQLITCRASD